uniref:Uncharacterized protein n=1 Tax=Vespula pensylvanica TaxID=30213 RepID=A0A834U5G2_VESPE|nr:hypothetical protein H0235_011729 [Vespula pensylvanica]
MGKVFRSGDRKAKLMHQNVGSPDISQAVPCVALIILRHITAARCVMCLSGNISLKLESITSTSIPSYLNDDDEDDDYDDGDYDDDSDDEYGNSITVEPLC